MAPNSAAGARGRGVRSAGLYLCSPNPRARKRLLIRIGEAPSPQASTPRADRGSTDEGAGSGAPSGLEELQRTLSRLSVEVGVLRAGLGDARAEAAAARERAAAAEQRAQAAADEIAQLRAQLQEQQQERDGDAAARRSRAAPSAPPTPTDAPAPPRAPPAAPELASPATAAAQRRVEVELCVGGDDPPESELRQLLSHAGVDGGADDVRFVGCARPSDRSGAREAPEGAAWRTLQFTLRTDEQRKQLFAARKRLQADFLLGRLDQQLTAGQHRQRAALRASPAFKAAEAEEIRKKEEGRQWRVLWLPHGCVIGDAFWTPEFARDMDNWIAAAGAPGAKPPAPAPAVPPAAQGDGA